MHALSHTPNMSVSSTHGSDHQTADHTYVPLMFPLLELHIRGREHRLEHDLRRITTEVEDRVRWCIRRRGSFDGLQEPVIRCNLIQAYTPHPFRP